MDKETTTILDAMWENFETPFLGSGQPGHWRQEPYRSDFFKAFASVYEIEPMDGEQVKRFLKECHLRRDDPRREEKAEELTQICDAWDEWKYAWDNYPKR